MHWQRVLTTVRRPAGGDHRRRRGRSQTGDLQSLCAMEEWAVEGRLLLPHRRLAARTRRMRPSSRRRASIVYIGLWNGPTEADLAELKKAGMPLICDQNAVGLAHKDDPTIIGWMHGDEPDNAQERPGRQRIRAAHFAGQDHCGQYEAIRKADPTRPVFLNLGRSRGLGRLPRPRRAAASTMRIIPSTSRDATSPRSTSTPWRTQPPPVQGRLDLVGLGVERLIKWGQGRKIVWNCIECTRISGIQGDAEAGQGGSLDQPGAREPGDHLFRPSSSSPNSTSTRCWTIRAMLAGVTALNKQVA